MFHPGNVSSTEVNLLACNIWSKQDAQVRPVRWGSIRTYGSSPGPKRTDIICASESEVVASIFWRDDSLSSITIRNKDTILHRGSAEEYVPLHSPQFGPCFDVFVRPVGFSWPDAKCFFSWAPRSASEDREYGIGRNGRTTATVYPKSPGLVLLVPVPTSRDRVEILLVAGILARYKWSMLDIEESESESESDEEFENEE